MSNPIEIADKQSSIVKKGDEQGLWPQDLNKEEKKKLAYISVQYGLDPFFSDLTILGSQPYVTASGLKRNAHESDDPPASIQLERVQSEGNRHFEYKALLWKQSNPEGKPFIEYGEASPDDCNKMISRCDKDLKAMARTRAVNRVIRLAYNINLTSAEEISGYDPDSQQIKDVTPKQENNEDKQGLSKKEKQKAEALLGTIYNLIEKKQADEDSINNWLKDQFGITMAHLAHPKYDKVARKVIDLLEKRPDAEDDIELTDEDIEEISEKVEEEDPFEETA